MSCANLGDYSVLIHLNQDIVAPEGTTAAAPAHPAQAEALHGVLARQRGHAPFHHFETRNRQQVSPCSKKTQLKDATDLPRSHQRLPCQEF